MRQAVVRAMVQFLCWVGVPTLLIYWLAVAVNVPPMVPTLIGMFSGMVLFVTMVERRWVR